MNKKIGPDKEKKETPKEPDMDSIVQIGETVPEEKPERKLSSATTDGTGILPHGTAYPKKRKMGNIGGYVPFRDGDDDVALVYQEPMRCPACGTNLIVQSLVMSASPYIHVDMLTHCPKHNWYFLFGVPLQKASGMVLHVYDSNAPEATKRHYALGTKMCPWFHSQMYPTKIFGDWTAHDDKVEYQWKCPSCHVTHHEMHDRDFEHLGDTSLNEKERAIITERMRRLGYIE